MADGWINYFKLANIKGLLRKSEEWLRRKIRAVYWKQWKRVRTRYRVFREYKLPEWKVDKFANCRKGIWRASIMMNIVLTNKEIVSLGYPLVTSI